MSIPIQNRGYSHGPEIFKATKVMRAKEKETTVKAIAKEKEGAAKVVEKLRDMGSIDISNMKGLLVLCHLDAIFGMSLPNCRTRNYIWNMMAFVKPNVMHFSRV